MRSRPSWLLWADATIRKVIAWVTCALLIAMVAFVAYTVVMRYVFRNAPYWGDTLAVFSNIWLVLLAYGLTVRERDDIAMEGLYEKLPSVVTTSLRLIWQGLTLAFGVFLVYFGSEAAMNVPGTFTELGGLPKTVPMMALPICGLLVALASVAAMTEDSLRLRERTLPATARLRNPTGGGGL